MDAVIQQSGAGGVIGGIVVIGLLGIFIVAKVGAYKQTKCMHCGHDNGLTGFQATICPACGRNKTVFNSRKARKR
jgi:hypothetical protein